MTAEQTLETTLSFPHSDQVPISLVSAPDPDQPRHTLLYVHAEGGLGRIHVAQDNELQRQVVVKELKPQMRCCRALNRFLREAQVTGQLEHPNIVPVYELSHNEDGNPYYVMRYLRGQTFKQAIADYHRRRRQGTTTSLDLLHLLESFLGVCQAVAYAHSRGVLHRDLKPENVMLGRFGEVIVLDWGLAKVLNQSDEDTSAVQLHSHALDASDPSNEETMTGEVLGTPAYMAPEQAEGNLYQIDCTTDVYGLGTILFEILTGRPPHQGESTCELLTRIVKGPTPRAISFEPSAPVALNAVCFKAMAHRQCQRYSSASDLALDVRRYLADEPVTAYRESWLARALRWARHHRSWSLTIAGAVLASIIIATVSSILMANMADKEKSARVTAEKRQDQSLRLSATFAARTVASEIDLRWRILEKEATNARLQRLLVELSDKKNPTETVQARQLLAWIESAFEHNAPTAKATSWFLNDAHGAQLTRWPMASTIGQNFAFRDYFHGRGSDITPEEAKDVEPLREVHRSVVFRSQANDNLMVAFSVPIWSESLENEPARVLGVLGMTVELGRFGALQVYLGQDQVAVLVDTRRDGIGSEGQSGLILHHPHLTALRHQPLSSEQKNLEKRLTSSRVEKLKALRRKRMGEEGMQLRTLLPESWDESYRDPIGGDYDGTWLAAFEPVMIPGRPGAIKDTGWVVIVQERR